ncbi:MAG: hypothetical protein RLZZ312_1052 [Bacteroidota bacterium]|jgi:uncharacterized protein (DUF2237 family)
MTARFIFFVFLIITKITYAQAKKNCIIEKSKTKNKMETQKNIFGKDLEKASDNPKTGFYRDGFCNTGTNDQGTHTVAAVMTSAFLEFSKSRGNDLISAYPASNFPGLKPGDVWCLCALRWKEAFENGVAPDVILEATNFKTLEFIKFENLLAHKK